MCCSQARSNKMKIEIFIKTFLVNCDMLQKTKKVEIEFIFHLILSLLSINKQAQTPFDPICSCQKHLQTFSLWIPEWRTFSIPQFSFLFLELIKNLWGKTTRKLKWDFLFLPVANSIDPVLSNSSVFWETSVTAKKEKYCSIKFCLELKYLR